MQTGSNKKHPFLRNVCAPASTLYGTLKFGGRGIPWTLMQMGVIFDNTGKALCFIFFLNNHALHFAPLALSCPFCSLSHWAACYNAKDCYRNWTSERVTTNRIDGHVCFCFFVLPITRTAVHPNVTRLARHARIGIQKFKHSKHRRD